MWNYEIANRIKKQSSSAREKAISDSTAFIGTIEQVDPLIVSIQGGEIIYEQDDIIKSKQFDSLTVKKGDSVIVVPVNSLDTIAVIDKVV